MGEDPLMAWAQSADQTCAACFFWARNANQAMGK
jgi:hypothetical protein